MIAGIGIDSVELTRVRQAVENKRFIQRILTTKEVNQLQTLSKERQIEFISGRFAAKEAFSKAWGTGIGEVSFQDLEVSADEKGAPYFSKSPHLGSSHLSITHTKTVATAIVILEHKNKNRRI